MGKQWKQLLTLFIYLLSEKPLHMMAAAMKLKKKKPLLLGRKFITNLDSILKS